MEDSETVYDGNVLLRVLFIVFGGLTLGCLLFFSAVFLYTQSFSGKIYRGVTVNDVIMGGLTAEEAAEKLEKSIRYPFETEFTFTYGDRVWRASPQDLGFRLQTEEMAKKAMEVGRSGGLFQNISDCIKALLQGWDLDPIFLSDERVAFNFISKIAEEIDVPMGHPSITLQGSEVVIVPGESGQMVNRELAMKQLEVSAQNFQAGQIELPVEILRATEANLGEQKQILDNLLSRDFVLYTNDERGTITVDTIPADILAGMIDFEPVIQESNVTIEMTPKAEPFYNRLVETGNEVYREPRNARFTFNESSLQLDLLYPAQTGKELDKEQSMRNITNAIRAGKNQAELALSIQQPTLKGTETAAELGISGLVHTENTYFFYSDEGRIRNIQVGSEKLNGWMIAPGETFSMSQAVGEVSPETGFAESSVIFGDATVQDVGGGLCQVSTTLFRAAFHYGLPIEERHAHGYRVYYYERLKDKQLDPGLAGMDAAVYLPVLDLKFTNDTPYWILMETEPNTELCQLQWRFYSTDVNRYVEAESSGLTNVEPMGEPVYNMNPDLPAGVINQVDWGIDGADVTITRTVYQDGFPHINDKFETHYEAWADIYEYGPGTEGIPTEEDSSQ